MENKKSIFVVQNRETGTFIEVFDSFEKAIIRINEFEQDDLQNDIYEEDFYEIQEVEFSNHNFQKFIKFLN